MSVGRKAPASGPQAPAPAIDEFRARHLALAKRRVATELGHADVTVDEHESPLAWLARRRGRDGRALIAPYQLQAGERLRADFTRAKLTPRLTSNWENPVASGGANGVAQVRETQVAARQRVHRALDAVGPELSGLLLDVTCFLKRLDDVERERGWPARSAKVVLQLALDRLAHHYGYAAQACGPAYAALRTWLAEDATFGVGAAE